MKELIEYIGKSFTLSNEITNDLKAIIIERNIQKGEIILQENSNRKIQIFVASGCLRTFYKTKNGKDHTLQFATKNWWISDYMTLFNKEKSLLSIESLSHSKIFIIEQSQLEKLYSKYPEFGIINRKNLQNRIASLQKRIFGLLTMTAKEKYQKFITDYDIFEKVIPNYQIASFLGITPESLSRVRKEIANS
ncbi:Crp/Fnr family transcriptional regulator [Portibacter marinus]|uniref:Crp/Fnr family transcriptional regulator n=1 Tax=Portibacter marinus TaxID=2898660 RepID=UPI001F1B00BB|nr:Crp/Fnr family transcriptional regulator [Portibacter marinus]